MDAPVVLGIDGGLTNLGIAIVRLLPDTEEVLALQLVRTKKDSKKRHTLASDDNVRRARELWEAVSAVVMAYPVRIIAAESMSFPRNSSTAAKIGIGWGIVAGLAQHCNLPVVQASPQAIKKKLCGTQSASKEEVESALLVRYGNAIEDLYEGPDSLREHPFDALSAVVTCLDSEVVRLARQMAKAS